MGIKRKFNRNGNCFESMFQDLVNSKVDEFVSKRVARKDAVERSVVNRV